MKKESLVLLILAFLQFVNIVDFMIMMPLGDELMSIFKISPAQFSTIVSAYTYSAFFSGLMMMFIIDRFDRKLALIVVFSGFTLGTFACGLAPSYILLVMARIFTGLFGGILGALVLSIVSDIIPVERRGTAMGILTASFSVASVVGVPGGLYFANLWGWHAPFFILGSIALLLLVLIFFFIPPITSHLHQSIIRKTPKELIMMLLNKPNQQLALTFMMLLILGQFTLIPFIAPYMIRNVGFTSEQIPLIYLVGGGLTMFSAPIVGKLADKFSRKKVFLVFAFISIIPLLAITHMPRVEIYYALIATGLFFITINGRMIPAMALMTSVVLPENRGSFMSLNSSFQMLGAGLASNIAGLIVFDSNGAGSALINYNYVGYLAVGFTILAIIISKKLITLEGN